jgi:uncharacterized protein (DUF1697 family)
MPVHVALLRAINLAGTNRVSMGDLRDLFAGLGFADVQSLLQSGNLVFRSRETGEKLERLLEKETAKRLGLETNYFVRTAAQWQSVVAKNPFPQEAKRDPGHLLVMFLKDAPKAAAVQALAASIRGPEIVRARGKELYVVYPEGVGRSRLTNAAIEKKLGTRSTGRNWRTVEKLRALTPPRG